MTIGKLDKIMVGDIVEVHLGEAGIPAQNIRNIAVFDRFSLSGPSNLADKVILAINDSVMKGKRSESSTRKRKGRAAGIN